MQRKRTTKVGSPLLKNLGIIGIRNIPHGRTWSGSVKTMTWMAKDMKKRSRDITMRKQVPQDFPSNRICGIDILLVSPPGSTTKVNLRDPPGQQQHSQIKWGRSMSKRPGHPHRRLPQRILHSPFGIQPLSNQPDHPSIRVLHFHIRSKRSLTSHLLPRGNTPFLHSSVNLRLPWSKFERENNDAKVFHQENGRSFWIFYVFWPPLSGSRIYYRYTRNVHLSNQSCGDA